MNTLSSAPVAPFLARLFAEADANPPGRSPIFAGVTGEVRMGDRLAITRARANASRTQN